MLFIIIIMSNQLVKNLDKTTHKYVNSYIPSLQYLFDNMIYWRYVKSFGTIIVEYKKLNGDHIDISVDEQDSLQKCSALKHINKNQSLLLKNITPLNFIRHIDISDQSDKLLDKKEIDFLLKNKLRCTSYPVDNSWIID